MPFDLTKLQADAAKEAQDIKSPEELEAFRIKYLGRRGIISEAISGLSQLSAEERPRQGAQLNNLKNTLNDLIQKKTEELKNTLVTGTAKDLFDITMPGVSQELGNKHPITLVIDEICAIFVSMGFHIVEGPEIETEFNNFSALNIPLEHPSRDVFDTFYINSTAVDGQKLLLRSHTSPVQIRAMKIRKPPLAIIVPGKVFRPDAVDASHSFMFHQIEGFLVDKEVRFSDLKGLLYLFAQQVFSATKIGGGQDIKMRFRPHFFPFTEPSAEVDICCIICKGEGCSVCGRKGWLEILGAGMIHPNVFKAVGYDPKKFTGLAFGMGIERIAMLKYGINDIRLFFENDLRFLKQF